MKIHIIQHVAYEGAGYILDWGKKNGHTFSYTHLYKSDKFPAVESFDFLIIMGGPMGIYDESEYSWLAKEKEFIKKIINSGKAILGICLGSQLLADALGAKVYANKEKEIGWFPVFKTQELTTQKSASSNIYKNLPAKFSVFHWHGDTFDLPKAAKLIASSKVCVNQAFQFGEKIVGLQFHLESTQNSILDLLKNCKSDLTQNTYVQSEKEILSYMGDYKTGHEILENILQELTKQQA